MATVSKMVESIPGLHYNRRLVVTLRCCVATTNVHVFKTCTIPTRPRALKRACCDHSYA
jgi:hypothetical protein